MELGDIDINAPGFLDVVFHGSPENTIRVLMEMGMNPDAVDSHGNTVLHGAAMRRQLKLLHVVAPFDVDPDARNNAGHTALDIVRRLEGIDPQT